MHEWSNNKVISTCEGKGRVHQVQRVNLKYKLTKYQAQNKRVQKSLMSVYDLPWLVC